MSELSYLTSETRQIYHGVHFTDEETITQVKLHGRNYTVNSTTEQFRIPSSHLKVKLSAIAVLKLLAQCDFIST